jgi:hypothetical protein
MQSSLYSLALKAKAERMIMQRDALTEQELDQFRLDLKYSSLSAATIHNYMERLRQPMRHPTQKDEPRSKDEK